MKMNDDKKKRYDYLKKKQLEKIKKSKWQNNEFFIECISRIGEYKIISSDQADLMIERISKVVSFNLAGHINWEGKKYKKITVEYEKLGDLVDVSKNYYIIWDNYELPAIKCQLVSIIDIADYVESVSFSYLIISEDYSIIMESKKFNQLNICFLQDNTEKYNCVDNLA